MLLALAVLGFVCLALTLVTARQVWQRDRDVAKVEAAALRYRAQHDERRTAVMAVPATARPRPSPRPRPRPTGPRS